MQGWCHLIKLLSIAQVKDRQPLLTPEDCILAEDIAKADAEVAAMVKEAYGITDLSLLACDPWSGETLDFQSCKPN